MKKKNYLPAPLAARVIWLNNFSSKLGGYAAAFGITVPEVALVVKFAQMYAYIIGLLSTVDSFKQDLTKYKDKLSRATIGSPLGAPPTVTIPVAPATVDAGIFTIIGGMVARIKGMKNVYTEAIGEDLRIVGDESSFDENTFKPTLKGTATPDGAKLVFGKDETDGVNIYTRNKGAAEFIFLARDTESPYIDTRPLANPAVPEVREFRCRAVLHDVEIAVWSDTVSVTVGG
jgi:hypothetical protein